MKRWQRTPLGTRLALGLGALALVVFAVVGTVLVVGTRNYLERQLDEQLANSQQNQTRAYKPGYDLKPPPYQWFTVSFTVSNGKATLKDTGSPPEDVDKLARFAETKPADKDAVRTGSLDGNTYRLRACSLASGTVLVSAAPMMDLDNTIQWLIIVSVSTFAAALVALVVSGRLLLRKGLRPLSDMAGTAHDIASHDLTDSAHLPTRADGTGGGPEVEELRTSFNVMLEHIDSSLAARTAAEQRLRQFVADASHELRTPLTSIRGYADLFGYAAANEPAEREAHLAKIREETARMSVLVEDLLLLARLDSDAPLRLSGTDLVDVASAAAQAFVAAHPDHPLTFDAPSSVPLNADPMRLRQILDNLLTNVARHTPPGTAVDLTVTAHATVTVSDTGPGIAAEHQERIFDRFYRVDEGRTRAAGGTGLGLAIVQSLVQAHGATITLTSEPGHTVFTIHFTHS